MKPIYVQMRKSSQFSFRYHCHCCQHLSGNFPSNFTLNYRMYFIFLRIAPFFEIGEEPRRFKKFEIEVACIYRVAQKNVYTLYSSISLE